MKKIALFLLIALLSVTGCTSGSSYNNEFTLGIIETTGQKNKSSVSFYDENVSKGSTLSFPYGSMEHYGFTEPQVREGHLYTIPLGLFNKKDLGMILDLDLESGKAEKIRFGRVNITSAVITDDAYYVASNLNQVSYIDRYDRKTGVISTISLEDQLVMHIREHEGKLVGIGTIHRESEVEIWLNEFDFQTEKTMMRMDITSWSEDKASPIHMITHDGLLYMSLGRKLLVYSEDESGIHEIELPGPFAQQILVYEGMLYILHSDIVAGSVHSTVTILNPDNEEMTSLDLKMKTWQIEIKDDLLYALDLENKVVTQFRIENNNITHIRSIEIETDGKMSVSGMFLK